MNLQELVEFVRGQVDADEDDAPEARLSIYAENAYHDIKRRRIQWPHLYVEYDLDLVAGTAVYARSALSVSDMEYVSGVYTAEDGAVPIVNRDDAIAHFGVTPTTGSVDAVSVGPTSITVYPTPAAAATLRVVGYRRFATWPSGTEEPDLPREFDIAIAWAMCRDFWASQEELESAAVYEQRYERAVRDLVGRMGRSFGSPAGPTYFTGPRRRGVLRYEDMVKRSLGY